MYCRGFHIDCVKMVSIHIRSKEPPKILKPISGSSLDLYSKEQIQKTEPKYLARLSWQ
jgi:hypothetical protein